MKPPMLPLLAISLLSASTLAQPHDVPAPAPQAAPAPAPQATPKRGLLLKNDGASPGVMLLAPLRSTSTYLVDLDGKVVHEWKSDLTPGHAVYLKPDGHLLRAEQVESEVFRGGGQGGRLREYDWDGKVVWEYLCADGRRLQHHDFKVMPNGHMLLIAWELVGAEKTLAAGREPNSESGEEMWPDMVLEIEPTPPSGAKVVWEWHAWDHLIQDHDAQKANYGDVAAHPERIDVNSNRGPRQLTAEERAERERLRGLGYGGGGEPEEERGGPPDGFGGPGGPGGRGDMRGGDWLHTNGIAYNASLDVVLLSVHNLNEIWVIDHATTSEQAKSSSGGRYGKGGDLLFRWGNPRIARRGASKDQSLFGQHDAHWIADGLAGAGHVLVFNNGNSGFGNGDRGPGNGDRGSGNGDRNPGNGDRSSGNGNSGPGDDRNKRGSSVDELAISLTPESLRNGFDPARGPKVEVAWSYRSPDIDSGHISGAQRLPNGNTLICAGETGRLVEVNTKNEVVWDYLSPLGGDANMPGGPGRRGGPPPGAGTNDGGERRPQAGVRRGPPGGFRGGPRGDDAHALFRAWRYPADFAGLALLRAQPTTPSTVK